MSGLTAAERRGARVLAVLLALGTLTDLYRARHPDRAPAPPPVAPSANAQLAPAAAALAPVAIRPTVDLDHASAAELDQLPGIGPVLAARIVEHRERHGRFRRVEELLAVPGIGPRLLERLRPWLRSPAP